MELYTEIINKKNSSNIIAELNSDLELHETDIFIKDDSKKKLPSNYGNKWTDDDRNKLLSYLKDGKEIEFIAHSLDRSEGGVRGEIKKIIFNKYLEGDDATKISKEMNIIYKNVKSIIKIHLERDCESEIAILEKENKLLELKIKNLKLRNELKELQMIN